MIKISDLIGGIPPNALFPGSGGVVFPVGPTSSRPVLPRSFEFRHNSELDILEIWNSAYGRWETIHTTFESQMYNYGLVTENTQYFIDYGSIAELNNTKSIDLG